MLLLLRRRRREIFDFWIKIDQKKKKFREREREKGAEEANGLAVDSDSGEVFDDRIDQGMWTVRDED